MVYRAVIAQIVGFDNRGCFLLTHVLAMLCEYGLLTLNHIGLFLEIRFFRLHFLSDSMTYVMVSKLSNSMETHNNGHYAVQGHSRSSLLVPRSYLQLPSPISEQGRIQELPLEGGHPLFPLPFPPSLPLPFPSLPFPLLSLPLPPLPFPTPSLPSLRSRTP